MAYSFTDSDTLKRAREQFKLADDADTNQADRERDDLAFYAGDQWPADVLAARMGQNENNGLPAVPARPSLVINKVREPVRQVQNEIRDSDIGIELVPADDFGDLGITPDDSEVTLREGLVRRAIRDSNGQDAWSWGGDRADIAGRGYFMVMTRFLPGKTNRQEVYLHRIFNQNGVKGDPSRTEPDGSDASFWFVGTWMLLDKVKAEYPKAFDGTPNPIADWNEQDFMSAAETFPNWYQTTEGRSADGKHVGKPLAVRVVDHFYTEYDSKTLVTLESGEAVWEDEAPEGAVIVEGSKRTVPNPRIKWCKIAGGIVELDRTDWPGTMMPVIEIVGEEIHPYDEQRRVEGMVRNARDSQRAFNYTISKWVESVGLAQIPRDRLDPDSIDGYQNWWAVANTRALPYLPVRTRDDQGQEFREPKQANVDPNILAYAQGVALFDQMIKSTTAVPDPTLGNVDPSLKSGRAIRETVANAKASTSNFLSYRMRSLKRAALVINDLLYPIYGQEPGRLVRLMTGDGQAESMVIGDPQQGLPQAHPQQQKALKVAKLTKDAMFNVAVKITKNFDTRREQENAMMGDLIAAAPEMMMPVIGDLYIGSSDMPNRKQAAKRFRVMLAPPIQKMLAEEESGGEQIPPAAQAKMAEMQQQLQLAEQAMQELAKDAEGNQLKAETQLQVEAMKADLERMKAELEVQRVQFEADRDLKLAEMDNATKIRIAEIAAETKGLVSAQALEHEAIALAHTQQHEATQASEQREHEARVTAHGSAMQDAEADRAEAEGERGRAFEGQQAERDRQTTHAENEANREAAAEQSEASE
jgi:hypothetical protein